jgi:hypothetical protein
MRIGDAFPAGNYLKAEDLGQNAVKVVIESVSVEKMGDDTKPVLHFVGKSKTLVLNKTNAGRITDAAGSDETDDWIGWTITLYATKVDFQGKSVAAIRVDDRPGTSRGPAKTAKAAVAEFADADEKPPAITDDDIPF